MAGSMLDLHHPGITSCLDDPNFATVCSFLEKFGETCHLGLIPFNQLQSMLENTNEVSPILAQIHIKLLRRIYKSINADKWEKHLAKFCHSYNSQDAWELERFGYKKSKIQTKLRLLKNLLEAQFDYNTKFKNEVNKLPAESLRLVPMGRDSEGQSYWYQVDPEGNLRIYREDAEDDTWELVATNREEMVNLIGQLEAGVVTRNAFIDENGTPENDENSPKEEEEELEEIGVIVAENGELPKGKDMDVEPNSKNLATIDPEITEGPSIPVPDSPKNTEETSETDSGVPQPEICPSEPMEIEPNITVLEPKSKGSIDVTPPTEIIESSSIENLESKTSSKEPIVDDEPKDEESSLPPKLPETDAPQLPSPEIAEPLSKEPISQHESPNHEESSSTQLEQDEMETSESNEIATPEVSEPLPITVDDPVIQESSKSSAVVEDLRTENNTAPTPELELEEVKAQPPSLIPPIMDPPAPISKLAVSPAESDSKPEESLEPSVTNSTPAPTETQIINPSLENDTELPNPITEIKEEQIIDEEISAEAEKPKSDELISQSESTENIKSEVAMSVCSESDCLSTLPSAPAPEAMIMTKSDASVVEEEEIKEESEELQQPMPQTLSENDCETKVENEDTSNIKVDNEDKNSEPELQLSSEELNILQPGETKTVKIEPEPAPVPVNEPIITKSSAWIVGNPEKQEVKLEITTPNLEVGTKMENSNNKPVMKSALGALALYDSSSESDDNDDGIENLRFEKRKADSNEESPAAAPPLKIPKLNDPEPQPLPGPIVGEAVEEPLMIISGDGGGAECEGGVETEQPIEKIIPPPTNPKGRGGGGRRGRPRGGGNPGGSRARKRSSSGSLSGSVTPATTPASAIRNGRLSTERPTRQSSRIAKIQEREEEERRKQEEERLAQLKEAQIRKQQKLLEKGVAGAVAEKAPGKSKSTPTKTTKNVNSSSTTKYLPTPSASDSDEDADSDDSPKKGKRGRKKKFDGAPVTLMKKGLNPWVHTSSEEEPGEEEEEEYHIEDYHEEEEEDMTLRSDHEFSPESDLEGDDDESPAPSRHARTRAVDTDKYATTNCEKCKKGDHPDWILLCDSCDKGCHASCLRPQLWVIPEGQWFCQPCQHKKLIEKMNQNLLEYDQILKKHENEVLRKQRLEYVGISLNNVLPAESESLEIHKTKSSKRKHKDKNKKRGRRLYSSEDDNYDEGDGGDGDDSEDELMDSSRSRSRGHNNRSNFIDSEEDESNISKFGESAESGISEDEPIYKLRARRATKGFNLQEYDEMINSALKDDDDVLGEIDASAALAAVAGADSAATGEPNTNGNSEVKVPKVIKSKGKVMPGDDELSDEEENEENVDADAGGEGAPDSESSGDENLDENAKKRKKALKNQSTNTQRKTRRRLNDLDATDDDDSDEDFKESEEDDDEEEGDAEVEDDDEDWSGDRDADESDDSIARRAVARSSGGGSSGKYGRKDKYLEVGSVRRSTRKARRKRVVYDESDQEDEDDEEGPPSWNDESASGGSESESNSESEDATWGKKKKKKGAGNTGPSGPDAKGSSSKTQFFMGSIVKSKNNKSGRSKKKKRKVDEDEEDKPWNRSKKVTSESLGSGKRSTRGKKINFKDILESGESDDDGNILPKRRRLQISSSSEEDLDTDTEAPSSSKKLVAEMRVNAAKNTPVLTPSEDLKPSGSGSLLEAELMSVNKPVPAPPLPPSIKRQLAAQESGESSSSSSPPPPVLQSASAQGTTMPITVPVPLPQPITIPTPPMPLPLPAPTQLSTNLMMSEILSSSSPKSKTKKSRGGGRAGAGSPSSKRSTPSPAAPAMSPVTTAGGPGPGIIRAPNVTVASPIRGLPPGSSPPHQPGGSGINLPPNMMSEVTRVPNPAYFGPPGSGMRFPWNRPPGPPGYGPPGPGAGPPNARSPPGKPPPLNNSPPYHMSQRLPGPPTSSPYPNAQPPPLRIPNPNVSSPSSVPSFQQFKREPQLMYRLPPGVPPHGQGPNGPGGPRLPPGILPPHLASSHPHPGHPVDRNFFGSAHNLAYGIPPQYHGIPVPPHTQAQPMIPFPPVQVQGPPPQAFEFRSDEPAPGGGGSTSSNSPRPPPVKDEPTDGEFGGLVSYFSSQRGEEDMDT